MHPVCRLSLPPRRSGLLCIAAAFVMLALAACQPVQPVDTGTVPPPGPSPSPQRAGASATAEAIPQQAIRLVSESTSPDGRWVAATITAVDSENGRYYQSLAVRAQEGEPRYVVTATWEEMALGTTLTLPLAWSKDSRRFYYTNRPNPDGCALFYNGSDLWRLNVATGETTQVLPAVTRVLGLSPDEAQVAYLQLGEPVLAIRPLEGSGEDVEARTIWLEEEIDDGQLGAITWSPAGEQLAFVVAHHPCSGGFAQSTSVYVVDVDSLGVTPLLLRDQRLLVPESWGDERTLRLADPSGRLFTIDVITGAETE